MRFKIVSGKSSKRQVLLDDVVKLRRDLLVGKISAEPPPCMLSVKTVFLTA